MNLCSSEHMFEVKPYSVVRVKQPVFHYDSVATRHADRFPQPDLLFQDLAIASQLW